MDSDPFFKLDYNKLVLTEAITGQRDKERVVWLLSKKFNTAWSIFNNIPCSSVPLKW